MSIKRLFSRKGKNPASSRTNSFLDQETSRSGSASFSLPSPMSSIPEKSAPAASTSLRAPQSSRPVEAPPSYSAAIAAPNLTASTTTSVTSAPGADDPYTFLTTFDTILLIDDSASMTLGTRWSQTAVALQTIVPIITAHDADGLDLYFLNKPASPHHKNITSPSTVTQIFSSVTPHGGTPTGQRLNSLLKPYLSTYASAPDSAKPKPLNLICITDGCPSDDVESVLIAVAKKLDALDAPAWQVGIQFFQVGDDRDARLHLEMLDDELAALAGPGGCRDIVDTVPFGAANGEGLTGEGILKVVLGAVNRRLDRKSVGGGGGSRRRA